MGYWFKVKEHLISICPSCNFLSHDAKETHCIKCGTLLIRECPQCKEKIIEDAKHCPYCGADYLRPKV
jgi:ribosomal protein S27AE